MPVLRSRLNDRMMCPLLRGVRQRIYPPEGITAVRGLRCTHLNTHHGKTICHINMRSVQANIARHPSKGSCLYMQLDHSPKFGCTAREDPVSPRPLLQLASLTLLTSAAAAHRLLWLFIASSSRGRKRDPTRSGQSSTARQ